MNLKENSYTHGNNFFPLYKNNSKMKITIINNSPTHKGVMYEKS